MAQKDLCERTFIVKIFLLISYNSLFYCPESLAPLCLQIFNFKYQYDSSYKLFEISRLKHFYPAFRLFFLVFHF